MSHTVIKILMSLLVPRVLPDFMSFSEKYVDTLIWPDFQTAFTRGLSLSMWNTVYDGRSLNWLPFSSNCVGISALRGWKTYKISENGRQKPILWTELDPHSLVSTFILSMLQSLHTSFESEADLAFEIFQWTNGYAHVLHIDGVNFNFQCFAHWRRSWRWSHIPSELNMAAKRRLFCPFRQPLCYMSFRR